MTRLEELAEEIGVSANYLRRYIRSEIAKKRLEGEEE